MRLEGTLNQIRLRCPGQIADCEVPWHLKEWLFHGVRKHVRDSIRYLYGNSETTYSELVVAAHRVESKTEETKERVKARSAAATEVASGSKELGDQIARLMAALTKVEQGSCPASALNSPRHRGCGRGQVDRNTPVCPSSQNGWTGLGQTVSIWSSSTTTRESTDFQRRWNMQAQNGTQGGAQSMRDFNILQCFRCQGWGHMARECATPSKTLNKEGETQQDTVSLQHSLSGPEPKPTQVKAVPKKEWKGIAPIPFLNPDLVAWLVGCANNMPVVIDGHEVTALIDLGAQVLNISMQLCKDLGLEIQPLGWLLELEGTGGAAIPYLRFVEVNFQIPGIRGYNEDVLLLAIPTMAYTEGVLVMVGSKMIGLWVTWQWGELAHATATWQQAHFRAVMLGSLQLSCSSSDKPKPG